jgi:hypothetical protein
MRTPHPAVELFLRLAPTRPDFEGQIIPGQLVSSPGALVPEGDALFSQAGYGCAKTVLVYSFGSNSFFFLSVQ